LDNRAKRRWIISIVAIAMAAPVGAAAADGSLERGQALLQQNCAMCHAVGRSGDSPSPTAPRFRELHKRYPIENLGEALSEGLLTGHPQMPEFHFAPGEVDDIIAYLKSIQTEQRAHLGAPAPAARPPV
jgi:mono/diheme cytochrome c family protein